MIPSRPTIAGVRKIGIIRSGAMGDHLVALPAIHALRHAYRDAELVAIGQRSGMALLDEGRSPIQRIIELPPIHGLCKEGVGTWLEFPDFINTMRDERFDLLVNFQGRGRTANTMINSMNARTTASFMSEGAAAVDISINYHYYQNETTRLLELAAACGAAPLFPEHWIRLLEKDESEAEIWCRQRGIEPDILINPLATDLRRSWPLENYVPLVRSLADQGYMIVLTGSADQKKSLDYITSQTGDACVNSAGELSVSGLTALICRSRLLIAPDTGPLHIAIAMNKPTIGMYWAPNLINWGPITRSMHIPIISWQLHCPFCGTRPLDPYPFEPRTSCLHEVSFIRDIRPQQVIRAVEQILQEKFSNTII